jgi:uncharacterized protein (DUF952 family)
MIFHITTQGAWSAALEAGSYTADSLETEGFIHCSEADQYCWVANQRFRGRQDLVLLHIDESLLDARVQRENLEGGEWQFPHVYGALNLDAVVQVTPFRPAATGEFVPQVMLSAESDSFVS